MENKDKKLSPRMDAQIKAYAKRLAYKIDPSLEQDFIQDMYVLWLELDLIPEALLWTAIKHKMSSIFRSRKYRYSMSKLRFLSYEELVKERNSHLIYDDYMEDIVILDELLSFLSPEERISFILFYGYNYTGPEIGKMIGVTRSMISRYKTRALDKMRRMLDE